MKSSKHLKAYGGFTAFVTAESKKIESCLLQNQDEPLRKRAACVESSNVYDRQILV